MNQQHSSQEFDAVSMSSLAYIVGHPVDTKSLSAAVMVLVSVATQIDSDLYNLERASIACQTELVCARAPRLPGLPGGLAHSRGAMRASRSSPRSRSSGYAGCEGVQVPSQCQLEAHYVKPYKYRDCPSNYPAFGSLQVSKVDWMSRSGTLITHGSNCSDAEHSGLFLYAFGHP